MEDERQVWKRIFVNHISQKGLVTTVYKEFTKLNSKKTNNPTRKWTKDMSRYLMQIANKHMKACSVFLAIRKMQIRTTVRN